MSFSKGRVKNFANFASYDCPPPGVTFANRKPQTANRKPHDRKPHDRADAEMVAQATFWLTDDLRPRLTDCC